MTAPGDSNSGRSPTAVPGAMVMALVRALATSKVTSLLERSEDEWRI